MCAAGDGMSAAAIPLRSYVVGGHLPVAIVDALIVHGEPMLSDNRDLGDVFPYRAWMRARDGHRTFGHPAPTVRLAAENLLSKLEGGR
jgi:hypothetical protein